jgi:hypothetical protein
MTGREAHVLDDLAVERLLTLRENPADPALAEAVAQVRTLGEGPAPRPTAALADLLERGFEPTVVPLRRPTAPHRRWAVRTGTAVVAAAASVLVAGSAAALPPAGHGRRPGCCADALRPAPGKSGAGPASCGAGAGGGGSSVGGTSTVGRSDTGCTEQHRAGGPGGGRDSTGDRAGGHGGRPVVDRGGPGARAAVGRGVAEGGRVPRDRRRGPRRRPRGRSRVSRARTASYDAALR